jgi:hypothetical protein
VPPPDSFGPRSRRCSRAGQEGRRRSWRRWRARDAGRRRPSALLQDPDGFFVQLVQTGGPAPQGRRVSARREWIRVRGRGRRSYRSSVRRRPRTLVPARYGPRSHRAPARGRRCPPAPARRLVTQVPGTSVSMTLVGMPRAARHDPDTVPGSRNARAATAGSAMRTPSQRRGSARRRCHHGRAVLPSPSAP